MQSVTVFFADGGWAYRIVARDGSRESGPIQSLPHIVLSRTSRLADVLACAGDDVPVAGNGAWQPLQHDGPGWEVRS